MISRTFKVIPHTLDGIVETASILRQTFSTDYIDCVIIARAIETKEELLTEDSKILRIRKELREKYDLPISKFADVIQPDVNRQKTRNQKLAGKVSFMALSLHLRDKLSLSKAVIDLSVK